MTGKYRLGFSIWALLLFLAVMIPNFIWFAVPATSSGQIRLQAALTPQPLYVRCWQL